jgi:hypothetical protein
MLHHSGVRDKRDAELKKATVGDAPSGRSARRAALHFGFNPQLLAARDELSSPSYERAPRAPAFIQKERVRAPGLQPVKLGHRIERVEEP